MEHSPQQQTRGRRIWAALCLGIGIVAAGYFLHAQVQSRTPQNRALLNQPLPSMMFEAAGANIDLKNYVRNRRCVIVFHSPSCRICRGMLPALRPFPPELRLILINESRDQASSETSSFPSAAIFQDRHRVLSRAFGATPLPIMLFVDENGVLRKGLAGWHPRDLVQEELRNFAAAHKPESGQNP